jgi:hypothetical protein
VPALGPVPATVRTIAFPLDRVLPGEYLVRVSVDGAQSPLAASADGTYAGPVVRIP